MRESDEEKDYYEILGVSKDASLKEIKSAYRKLAKLYHPDLFPNDREKEEKFRLIKTAYEVLSNEEKRKAYDQFGKPDTADGREFFENIFVTSTEARKCEDILQDVYISPQQKGAKVRIYFERLTVCPLCGGKGTLSPTTNWQICPTCGGKGRKKKVKADILSEHILYTRCPDCSGRGKIPTEPCPRCEGKGRVKKRQKIELKIPPRLREGEKMVLKGLGDECIEGGKGNLIITFHIAKINEAASLEKGNS